MSLIDEALKRARQEAARQDSAQAEGRFARVPVYAPPTRSSRPWLLPVVLAGCLAVGIGVGVILSRRGSTPAVPPPAVAEHRAPEVPRRVDPPQQTAAAQPEAPAPAAPPRIVEETPAPAAPRAEAPATPVLRPEPVQQEAPRPSAQAPTTPAPPNATPAPPAAGPEVALPATPPASTYEREVPLPDGGTLRLNGIAFSGQPVALFGDKVVAPGESINGFTVIEIEARRVKLQSQGGATVYVTLR
jgi:hypothetical protein